MERHGGKYERVTRLFATPRLPYDDDDDENGSCSKNPFERMGEFGGTFFDVCRVLFVMGKK